jgi:hypothetical protein
MIWKIWKKGKLNSDKIWTIWKKGKLNCEKIWKIWKKSRLNSEKIGKIWKKDKLNSENVAFQMLRFEKVREKSTGKLKCFITPCIRKASNVAFQTLRFEKVLTLRLFSRNTTVRMRT